MQALDTITKIAGRAVELTIRGEKSFTFSFDGRDDSASARLMDFFRSAGKAASDYDAECDHTCVYVDA
ncbi:hypothetical protein D0839_16285 [Bordetella avium]|uniref:hypothetical protein n=1 Tax=Bordetella avium TaxID=521 RepID=UPI000E686E74|nr:hypothetical protein [Bordetella avium]RIQ65850.1 hypothetical protein D0839_16285 [Bordetella avium]